MENNVNFINKYQVLKFLSSVKLAVPLMIILLLASAVGTIVESRYNANYAGLVVYDTVWFYILLTLLGINILFAALSRYPWKKHQLGFLITHLGMLVLLFGSFLTMKIGIDGILQVSQNDEENMVYLSDLILQVDSQKIYFDRPLERMEGGKAATFIDGLSSDIQILKILPFVEIADETFQEGSTIDFNIKSQFFDVNQSLNTVSKRDLKMGPALFRLVDEISRPVETKKNEKKISADKLIVKNNNGDVVKSFELTKNEFSYKKLKFKINKKYLHAQIVDNVIQEGPNPGANPALEVFITTEGKTIREIMYAKFPDFSLNADGIGGYRFEFQSSVSGSSAPAMDMNAASNIVEFAQIDDSKLKVALFKNGKIVQEKEIAQGDKVQTPWMGMELTYKGVSLPSAKEAVTEIPMPIKSEMPPMAMLIKVGNAAPAWIVENSEMTVGNKRIYMGRDYIHLPFKIFLNEFRKIDYPGGAMTKSFESTVSINKTGMQTVISMNEPLQFAGYTVYQSSYSLEPGRAPLSVFSINKDPGRWLKYLGSIILSLGIIIFVIMRSKWYLKRK